jgi:hypothetical protein
MAAFSGASIGATTVEDALVEIAYKLSAMENDPVKNATGADNVQVSLGTNGNVVISASIPADITVDAQGHPVINAKEYLA